MGGDAQANDQKLDTLDDAGNFIQVRCRGDVHTKGFWHRSVHIWIVDLYGDCFMMQRRAPSKQLFGGMWCCCTGHVAVGEPSLLHAQRAIESDFKLVYPETAFEFLFSCKEGVQEHGLWVKQMIDVYALKLPNPPPTDTLAVDAHSVDGIKYVTLPELKEIYRQRPADHVVVSNPEYAQRLFRALAKALREFNEALPQNDSDDERNDVTANELLDTLDESGSVVAEPGRRGEVQKQSTWHRAVHVFLFDVTTGNVLLLQRSKRRRHFRRQWNCVTGHMQVGDSSAMAACAALSTQVGLTRFSETEVEFLFQARNETDTGAGCLLKQLVDIYCVSIPSESYPGVPMVDDLHLDTGEFDAVQYMSIDDLEAIWAQGKSQHPLFVMPSSAEYPRRLLYLLRQKLRQVGHRSLGGTSPRAY